MNMDTFYTLLDIPAEASAEEIDVAYERQRKRYSAERVAGLGGEFSTIAETRSAALARAYAVLSDAERRREYDASIGLGPTQSPLQAARRGGLSKRELIMAAGGALAGLLVIALVWVL